MSRKRMNSNSSCRSSNKKNRIAPTEVASSGSVAANVLNKECTAFARQRLKELFISYTLADGDQTITPFFEVILLQLRLLIKGYNEEPYVAFRKDLKDYLIGLAGDDNSSFTMFYIAFSFAMLLKDRFESVYKDTVESDSSTCVVLYSILREHYLVAVEDLRLDETKIKDLIEHKIFDSSPLDEEFQVFKQENENAVEDLMRTKHEEWRKMFNTGGKPSDSKYQTIQRSLNSVANEDILMYINIMVEVDHLLALMFSAAWTVIFFWFVYKKIRPPKVNAHNVRYCVLKLLGQKTCEIRSHCKGQEEARIFRNTFDELLKDKNEYGKALRQTVPPGLTANFTCESYLGNQLLQNNLQEEFYDSTPKTGFSKITPQIVSAALPRFLNRYTVTYRTSLENMIVQFENFFKKFILSGTTTEKYEDSAEDEKKTKADRKVLWSFLTNSYNGKSSEFIKLPPKFYDWYKEYKGIFVREDNYNTMFLKKVILLGLYTQELDKDLCLDDVMIRRKNFFDFCRGTIMKCPKEYEQIYKKEGNLFNARPHAEVKDLKGFTEEHQKNLIQFLENGWVVACPETYKSSYMVFRGELNQVSNDTLLLNRVILLGIFTEGVESGHSDDAVMNLRREFLDFCLGRLLPNGSPVQCPELYQDIYERVQYFKDLRRESLKDAIDGLKALVSDLMYQFPKSIVNAFQTWIDYFAVELVTSTDNIVLRRVVLLGIFTRNVETGLSLQKVASLRRQFLEYCLDSHVQCPPLYVDVYRNVKYFSDHKYLSDSLDGCEGINNVCKKALPVFLESKVPSILQEKSLISDFFRVSNDTILLRRVILLGIFTKSLESDHSDDAVMNLRRQFLDFCLGRLLPDGSPVQCPELYQDIYDRVQYFKDLRPESLTLTVKSLENFEPEEKAEILNFLKSKALDCLPDTVQYFCAQNFDALARKPEDKHNRMVKMAMLTSEWRKAGDSCLEPDEINYRQLLSCMPLVTDMVPSHTHLDTQELVETIYKLEGAFRNQPHLLAEEYIRMVDSLEKAKIFKKYFSKGTHPSDDELKAYLELFDSIEKTTNKEDKKSIFITKTEKPTKIEMKKEGQKLVEKIKQLVKSFERILQEKGLSKLIQEQFTPSSVAKKTVEMAKLAKNSLNDMHDNYAKIFKQPWKRNDETGLVKRLFRSDKISAKAKEDTWKLFFKTGPEKKIQGLFEHGAFDEDKKGRKWKFTGSISTDGISLSMLYSNDGNVVKACKKKDEDPDDKDDKDDTSSSSSKYVHFKLSEMDYRDYPDFWSCTYGERTVVSIDPNKHHILHCTANYTKDRLVKSPARKKQAKDESLRRESAEKKMYNIRTKEFLKFEEVENATTKEVEWMTVDNVKIKGTTKKWTFSELKKMRHGKGQNKRPVFRSCIMPNLYHPETGELIEFVWKRIGRKRKFGWKTKEKIRYRGKDCSWTRRTMEQMRQEYYGVFKITTPQMYHMHKTNQHRFERASIHSRYSTKPNSNFIANELKLAETCAHTTIMSKFGEYCQARNNLLVEHWSYFTIKKFRRHKLDAYISKQKLATHVRKQIRRMYATENGKTLPAIAFGNANLNHHQKGCKPTGGDKWRKILAFWYMVLTVNEFRTSANCTECSWYIGQLNIKTMESFKPPGSMDVDHADDINANVSKENSFKTNAKCSKKRGNPAHRCQMCSNINCPLHGQPINRDNGAGININKVTHWKITRGELPGSYSRKYTKDD